MEEKQKCKTQYKLYERFFGTLASLITIQMKRCSRSQRYWPRENERRTSARARHACQGNVGTKQTIVFSGRGNSGDNDVGPILLPPRDYDTVHRHRGNLAGIEFRRCLNQTIVGGGTAIDRGGTRSAASSGIGSDSAATPPPYQTHHPLGQRPSRPSRDSSSGEWFPSQRRLEAKRMRMSFFSVLELYIFIHAPQTSIGRLGDVLRMSSRGRLCYRGNFKDP